MKIIPAIDLKDGQCVRLLQGRINDVTVYSDDPAATAMKWASKGADIIHIVDLDGAFSGEQKNLDAIVKIRKAVEITLELGGGIRDLETIDKLVTIGIDRIILGTAAIERPELLKQAARKYPNRIIVGIDAKNGIVAIKGWETLTSVKAKELALAVEQDGAAGIIYTDISKDGMLIGPNILETYDIVNAVRIPVIASGGISTIEDIKNLLNINGLYGAITGKAIYSGSLDLGLAIALASSGGGN
ncbi:MAG: 1-(5-phosphoribosyl)-5-[(5-phosphoribosylamino)methylideneamino]imidazole-4-carboxamide isomerase [Nitrospirae bacterium]|nr:1-(5-phosphoribosyl)-5-[(5-phosphoribosylamino)methylideneamino]imidazole-4-carboxamide isomerase [Nitrospirota bacterium]